MYAAAFVPPRARSWRRGVSQEVLAGPPTLDQLDRRVAGIFDAYQHSRFGYVTAQAPGLLQDTVAAARAVAAVLRQRRWLVLLRSSEVVERRTQERAGSPLERRDDFFVVIEAGDVFHGDEGFGAEGKRKGASKPLAAWLA
jgi:hypothetical protein